MLYSFQLVYTALYAHHQDRLAQAKVGAKIYYKDMAMLINGISDSLTVWSILLAEDGSRDVD